MKLYELKPNTKFKLLEDIEGPPDAYKPNKDEEYLFKHLDGMYSLCYDMKNRVIHIVGWAEVKELKES